MPEREFLQIEFIVPAVPVAQPRQRTRVVTKAGRSVAVNYTPARAPVNAFKATVRLAFASTYHGAPLAGPVRLTAMFNLPRPKSKIWKTKPMPPIPCAKKPDIDNLLKSLADALTGLAWRDDAQITDVFVTKWICAGDDRPHVSVRISQIDDLNAAGPS